MAVARIDAGRDPLRLVFILAGVVGYGYVASLVWHPYAGSFALMAVPALMLLVLSALRLRGRERVAMIVAFAGAAAGDGFLDLDRTGYLRHGLACFLLTQIGFTVAFAGRARWSRAVLPLLLVLVAAEAVLLGVAWDGLGALRIPVTIYLATLLAMVGSALMVRNAPWIGAGALAFLLSDSLIGVNAFIAPFAHSTPLIVSIYLAALLMIAWGFFGLAQRERLT